jgi:hypothetical protein
VTETDHGTRRTDAPRLDFLYVPSSDVAADLAAFVDGLGASVAFAIDGMGTRVAMLELGDGPPILLAGHLTGVRAILVYAVDDLDAAVARAVGAGFDEEQRVELPPGPAVTMARNGHRIALYAPIRPGVVESFRGRRDF